jgi:hypothetical protein
LCLRERKGGCGHGDEEDGEEEHRCGLDSSEVKRQGFGIEFILSMTE